MDECSHGVPHDQVCEDCDLITRCYEYLAKQKTVLWGEAFEIHDEKGRENAAKWLAMVFAELVREPNPYAKLRYQDDRISEVWLDDRNNSTNL